MREIVLQIPTLEAKQNIEIDVQINGKKRRIQYRVEIVDWETDEPTSEEMVAVLRRVIREGLTGTSMPAWSSVLNEQQIEALAQYVHEAIHPLAGEPRP